MAKVLALIEIIKDLQRQLKDDYSYFCTNCLFHNMLSHFLVVRLMPLFVMSSIQ